MKTVIGKGQDKKLHAVSALRKAELFVLRQEPGTIVAEVEETLSQVIHSDDDLKKTVANIKCEQLETRHKISATYIRSLQSGQVGSVNKI